MTIGKGDVRSQRQRRRNRYRGCRVCGVRGVQCAECDLGEQLVAIHGYASLSLVVDGSFVEWSDADAEADAADDDSDGLGHGGAGLVLVRGNEILASRACGFRAAGSSDAEYHAVIRAARWAPGVAIYTDARELPVKFARVNPELVVRYLDPNRRSDAYVLAHRLSVEGRCRDAPQTLSPAGIDFVTQRAALTKNQRRMKALRRSVTLLLKRASEDPAFDGDFAAIAKGFGWDSGRFWQGNPAIRIATARWAATAKKET